MATIAALGLLGPDSCEDGSLFRRKLHNKTTAGSLGLLGLLFFLFLLLLLGLLLLVCGGWDDVLRAVTIVNIGAAGVVLGVGGEGVTAGSGETAED